MLDDTDVQGHIIPGFGRGYQIVVGLDLENVNQGQFCEWVAARVTSMCALSKERLSRSKANSKSRISVSVSLDCVFRELSLDMPQRVPLGPVGSTRRTAFICISALDPATVEESFNELKKFCRTKDSMRFAWRGRTGAGTEMDVNPFGFVDGRLQPRLAISERSCERQKRYSNKKDPAASIGDFIVGQGFRIAWDYNNFGLDCRQHEAKLRNGSFLVLLRFAVSVSRFYESLEREVERLKKNST